MAPASNEEQFKFLISCIRYSNNGKVDFGQVASECRIVSKGAAAKRYERMMRAHGIASNAATVKTGPPRSYTKTESRDSSGAIPKKRKAEQFLEENTMADDEEGYGNIKSDPIDMKEQFNVKEEEGQLSLNDAANLIQFYDPQPYSSAHLGDHDYSRSVLVETSTGYHTPMTFGFQAPNPYAFPISYSSMADTESIPRSSGQLPYRSPYQYTSDGQGGSASPVVLE